MTLGQLHDECIPAARPFPDMDHWYVQTLRCFLRYHRGGIGLSCPLDRGAYPAGAAFLSMRCICAAGDVPELRQPCAGVLLPGRL